MLPRHVMLPLPYKNERGIAYNERRAAQTPQERNAVLEQLRVIGERPRTPTRRRGGHPDEEEFVNEPFWTSCSVCNRLWFSSDICPIRDS